MQERFAAAVERLWDRSGDPGVALSPAQVRLLRERTQAYARRILVLAEEARAHAARPAVSRADVELVEKIITSRPGG